VRAAGDDLDAGAQDRSVRQPDDARQGTSDVCGDERASVGCGEARTCVGVLVEADVQQAPEPCDRGIHLDGPVDRARADPGLAEPGPDGGELTTTGVTPRDDGEKQASRSVRPEWASEAGGGVGAEAHECWTGRVSRAGRAGSGQSRWQGEQHRCCGHGQRQSAAPTPSGARLPV